MLPWCCAPETRCATAGIRPSSAGPSTTPARISPITFGWRRRTKSRPSNWARPTSRRRTSRTEVRAELDIRSDSTRSDALKDHPVCRLRRTSPGKCSSASVLSVSSVVERTPPTFGCVALLYRRSGTLLRLSDGCRARLQHLLRVTERRLRHRRSADHARDLFGAFGRSQQTNGGVRAPLLLLLLNQEVLIGEGRDLRQVGHAKHLLDARQSLQLAPDRFRRAPANPDIDFVEDQGSRNLRLLRPGPRGAFLDADLQGQQDARHLPARGN